MTTAINCTVLLGLLLFAMGLAVSLTRGSTKINYGYPDDPAHILHRLCRAHGNAAEYCAMFAVLMLFIGFREPTVWMLWVMWICVAARYVHAIGMLMGSLDKLQPVRFIGALFTYLGGFALCVAAVMTI